MSKNDGFTHDARDDETSDVWITPKFIIDALGPFDLDPCHLPDGKRAFDTAAKHYHESIDGLSLPWEGRVYLNPPYGDKMRPWLERMAQHGNGIVLIFMRPETAAFGINWLHADAMLILPSRVTFLRPPGWTPPPGKKAAAGNAGCASVLIAFGPQNVECLRNCGLGGIFIPHWEVLPKESQNAKTNLSLF